MSATRRVLCTHPAACGLIDVVYGGGGNVSSGLVPGVSNSVMTVSALPQLLVCERRVVVQDALPQLPISPVQLILAILQ